MRARQDQHIDEVFRSALDDYEIRPPHTVWDGIEAHILRKKRRVLWIRRVAAAAAVLLLVFSGIWFLHHKKEPIPSPEMISESVPAGESTPEKTKPAAETYPAQAAPEPSGETETGPGETPIQKTTDISPILARVEMAAKQPSMEEPSYEHDAVPAYVEPLLSLRLSSDVTAPQETVDFRSEGDHRLALTEKENEVEWDFLKEERSRWGIGGQFSPAYSYRHLTSGEGSKDLKQYYNRIEEGVFAFSGGINVNYQASGKWTVYTGLYYSQMGLMIGGVEEYTLAAMGWETPEIHRKMAEKFYLVDHSTGTVFSDNDNIKIVNTPEDALYNSIIGRDPSQYTQEYLEQVNAFIAQNYEFLEIPLLVKYKVIDRKVGMNILGGVSTNFLVGNAASLYIEGVNYSSIRTSNVSTLNYSGAIGLGLDYEILPGLMFNVEPTFKYYLNTFSEKNLIGSHPYSVAVFSGVRFRF